jgi:hypothetical protein
MFLRVPHLKGIDEFGEVPADHAAGILSHAGNRRARL